MKRFIFAAIAIALVTINPALADDGGSRGHGHGNPSMGGGHQGGARGHNPGYNGHNPGYNPGHAGSGYRPAHRPAHAGYRYNGANNYRWNGYPRYSSGYYPYRPAYHPVRYPYYGYPYYQHHNNNNNNDSAAYLVGGLLVGSLLTNAYHNAQTTVYTQPAVPTNQGTGAAQGRHLLRDLSGNCYEVTIDGAGNELRTQLPPAQCNY